jgi:hypothetical protein
LHSCNCLDYNALCKHIFLVSRVTGFSYTFKNDYISAGGIEKKNVDGIDNFDVAAINSAQATGNN